MNIKTILLPTDLTRAGQPALELATSLARDSHARMIIAYVEEPLPADRELYYMPIESDREQLSKTLQEVTPTDPGVDYEHRLLMGDPAEKIVELAREVGADLIVMPTHGRKGWSRLLLGSVAEQVLRRAPCPVLSLRQNAEAAVPVSRA